MRAAPFTLMLLAVVLLATKSALGMGEILGQSKDELKLKYDVVVHDPANGQVSVEFTLTDEGRLKPLYGVELAIPRDDGSGSFDLTAPLDMREVNGKRSVFFNLKTEWAQRGQIWLNTRNFDGKPLVMTHYHHIISLASYMNKPAPATQSALPGGDIDLRSAYMPGTATADPVDWAGGETDGKLLTWQKCAIRG